MVTICVYSGCCDVLKISTNLNGSAFLKINGVHYNCTINGISKSETINSLRKADFNEKSESLEDVRT